MNGSNNISELVNEQKAFFKSGRCRDVKFRIAALSDLEKALITSRDVILRALEVDLGKPGVEAYLAEYYFVLQELRAVRSSLKKWAKPQRVKSPFYFMPVRSEIRREAYGVSLIYVPWNYPFQLALAPLISAIAAGNTVILKVSEDAPESAEVLSQLLTSCFTSDYVVVVRGNEEVAKELLEQAVDFIFFTGSTHVGKIVGSSAAGRLIPHVLELGGKCPCLVDDSAEIELTAKRVLLGKFFNAGQTCFAPDFVVVHENLKEALVAEMITLLEKELWKVDLAQIVNERHYQRIQSLVVGEIVQLTTEGEDLKFPPTLLPNASWDDPIMREEIFGPILPILSYGDEGELINKLQELGAPLALYLFTSDPHWSERVLSKVPSGGVCINDTMKQSSNLNLPFGGVGESGYGRYRGRFGFEAFSYQRAVVTRSNWEIPWFEIMPPYGDLVDRLKRFMR
ncbi:aldehyde dehydrogenase family protein [Rubritalea spongiae]|uniref:Aldehyde dehydrogenase n=1 Tax=Rubritalea spongiae TaxID=430797 RepID=A0ABW5DYS4_9BACT